MSELNEKACVYAALILADENLEITADKLSTLISAAGLEVESIWSSIFAKALAGKNINDMIANVGSASAAPVAAAGAPAAAAGGAAAAKEEKKEEAAEESDDDMGFGLFD